MHLGPTNNNTYCCLSALVAAVVLANVTI